MKIFTNVLIAILFFWAGDEAVAQSYDFRQGYIFEQKFVKRISISQAEEVASSFGFFEPLMSWEWGVEKIADPHVKRIGNRLVFDFDGKGSLSLRDYTRKATKIAEGELQKFVYIKSVPFYHVVGVLFGHDQPAFLLVSTVGENIYFVDTH
ncbi:hypothetical protein [Undibacterium flavidum]|uniref:PepSY-like beta-lactamase-inhibitor n=1 Tax=Undibacterium flavidum TaxID=2762297 RepID=A0ABR6Y9V4_9BURK|nr:hypothetical protein [Undibacterium flavidum]MBC3873376.1 hypothetical protein [Undibacterium flavidum]